MTQRLNTIILAAGKGTRMKSNKPKVLHQLAGISLLEHCYNTAKKLGDNFVQVVYGHGGDSVLTELKHLDVKWIEQVEQLGTGHAVQQAIDSVEDSDCVLILYGDVPLLKASTLDELIKPVDDKTLGLLTVKLDRPKGYGRIIRDKNNKVLKITEERDANETEKQVNEINTGILAVKGHLLKTWLQDLSADNAQGEYYLTDIIEMAVNAGVEIITRSPEDADEVLGVNDKIQLSYLERSFQIQQANGLMSEGVGFADPTRFDLRGSLQVGMDVIIDVNVIVEGEVSLGNSVKIGAGCILKDCTIADGTEVFAYSIIDSSSIGQRCRIGPFARIRPESKLSDEVHIGNFVEIKKSKVDIGSKINHLSYIGDTIMGSKVNIGAGTITCNYDGANKFQTTIGNDVFIGSDSQLVAPVKINDGATIGAGSTITKDTPENELTLSRAKQLTIRGWTRPRKK